MPKREYERNDDPDNNWTKLRPDYYELWDGNDVMDLIDQRNMSFQRGSALKYILRAGRKPGTNEIVELRKAIECLEREIERMEPVMEVDYEAVFDDSLLRALEDASRTWRLYTPHDDV